MIDDEKAGIGGNTGPAIILVFANGIREAALIHPHDGGEPYMVPFLRKGILYAKTHYDCGNIVEVLLSESDTKKVEDNKLLDIARTEGIRHIYYITYRWDADAGKKIYHLTSLHLPRLRYACTYELPTEQFRMPQGVKCIV